jgi:hypothetical protein
VIFSSRPPPTVLIVHGDGGGQASIGYFAAAPSMPIADMLECAVTRRPDMIVLDYDCEGGVIERLKADARTAPIPIIALAELPVPPLPPGMRDTSTTASVS